MKTPKSKLVLALFVALMLTTSINLSAQRGRGFARQGRGFGQQGMCMMFLNQYSPYILNLTDEQREKIFELSTSQQKEILSLRSQLNENWAKNQSLMLEDNPDMNVINTNIEERTGIMNKIMKSNAEFRNKISEQLTDEQKLIFNTQTRGFGRGYGSFGRGYGRGFSGYDSYGRGFGRGFSGYNSYGRGFGRGYGSYGRGYGRGFSGNDFYERGFQGRPGRGFRR